MHAKLRAIADQVIVVTGASSGIGLVTARMAAAGGARVTLVSRNGEALRDIVSEIGARGGVVDYAVADVGDRAQIEAAAAHAFARFGRIDCWVNCAGVAIYAKLADTPHDEHERLFRTNYFGVVNGALAALPHLRANGGALITVGSIASDMPSPIMGAYAASKHAAKAYIEALRIELNAERAPIRVTLIKPAGIDTPIAHHAARHIDGRPLIPPPAYDPVLVAKAILDAAAHSRRDVVVGGTGQIQVLLATHFPWFFERLGGVVMSLMVQKGPQGATKSISTSPGWTDRERSGDTPARTHSLYTAAQRHPSLTTAGLAGAGFVVLFLAARRVRRLSADIPDESR